MDVQQRGEGGRRTEENPRVGTFFFSSSASRCSFSSSLRDTATKAMKFTAAKQTPMSVRLRSYCAMMTA